MSASPTKIQVMFTRCYYDHLLPRVRDMPQAYRGMRTSMILWRLAGCECMYNVLAIKS